MKLEESNMKITINRYIEKTTVEGPGTRACIWVQGCPIKCKDCINEHMWNIEDGITMDINDLLNIITSVDGIEGVTILGGEPFYQAESVYTLGNLIKQHSLSLVVFTGYTLKELQQNNNKYVQKLLSITDLLIDGPYLDNKQDFSRPWIGSTNQQYHFLTDRYAYLKDTINNIKNGFDIRISPKGEILINGMGDINKLKKMLLN